MNNSFNAVMSDDILESMYAFDWVKHVGPETACLPSKPISIMQITSESVYDRKLRMISQLSNTCTACTMCELGFKPAIRNNLALDPHVLSNLRPHPFMVVGQNPGWTELRRREPFVGDAGETFNEEVLKYELSRDDFYICNIVRCYTSGNSPPTSVHIERCAPFLQIELNIIKPRLVITMGAVAFSQFCPGVQYSEALGKITKSERYGVAVFAMLHPSPLNLSDGGRRSEFNGQVKIMCALVQNLKLRVQS